MFIFRIVCCRDSWSGPGNPTVNPRLVFSIRIDLVGQPADADRHGVNTRHEDDLVAGGHALEIDTGFQPVADVERVVHDQIFAQFF